MTTALAFLLAAGWRPERPVNSPVNGVYMRPLEWIALAAFYVAMVAFVGEVVGE